MKAKLSKNGEFKIMTDSEGVGYETKGDMTLDDVLYGVGFIAADLAGESDWRDAAHYANEIGATLSEYIILNMKLKQK